MFNEGIAVVQITGHSYYTVDMLLCSHFVFSIPEYKNATCRFELNVISFVLSFDRAWEKPERPQEI